MSVKRRRFTSRFKAEPAMEAVNVRRAIKELSGFYRVYPSRVAPELTAWRVSPR
ncbi:MAG: hypothetical protein M0Z43_01125 [Acidithiobacillus sp.]|nr:hypothetical protein [Acidithiobacillus sp.]